jgi:hypothetical protein
MINKKLLEVLSRLSNEEHRQLKLFLQSPFFYQDIRRSPAEIIRLYEYIMRYHADENSPELEKPLVSKLFFPEKAYKEKEKGPIDALTTDMFSLVRSFIGLGQEKKPSEETQLLKLMAFYRKFGLEERFERTQQALEKQLDAQSIQDTRYFMTHFLMTEEVFKQKGLQSDSDTGSSIVHLLTHLDMYYAINRLSYMGIITEQQKLFEEAENTEPEYIMNNAVLTFADSKIGKSNAAIQLSLSILQKSENTILDEVLQFGNQIKAHESELSKEQLIYFYSYYRNLLSQQYSRNGTPETQKQLFETLQVHLNKGLLYYDEHMHIANLRMLTTHALKQNQTEWIRKVLEQHPPERLCGTKYPKEACDLNWAEYYFHLKDYEKAAQRLEYKPFEHPMLSIIAEALLLKIYYVTNNELLDARMHALRQKVRRSKLSPPIKTRYNNFIRLLGNLDRLKTALHIEPASQLVDEITSTPNVMHREWLLEQAKPFGVSS